MAKSFIKVTYKKLKKKNHLTPSQSYFFDLWMCVPVGHCRASHTLESHLDPPAAASFPIPQRNKYQKSNPAAVACHWKECSRNTSVYPSLRPAWALLQFITIYPNMSVLIWKCRLLQASNYQGITRHKTCLLFSSKFLVLPQSSWQNPRVALCPSWEPRHQALLSQEQLTQESSLAAGNYFELQSQTFRKHGLEVSIKSFGFGSMWRIRICFNVEEVGVLDCECVCILR